MVNQAVTLTDPVLDETAGTLTYTAALVPSAGDDDSFSEITCDGDTHLFIDDTINVADFVSCGQSGLACEAAGGTWDAGTNTCTPGVTQLGCEAGGGTWDAATSTCTPAYNCFIGAFCAEIDSNGLHSQGNVYAGHTPGAPPALGAGCNDLTRVENLLWSTGEVIAACVFPPSGSDVCEWQLDAILAWVANGDPINMARVGHDLWEPVDMRVLDALVPFRFRGLLKSGPPRVLVTQYPPARGVGRGWGLIPQSNRGAVYCRLPSPVHAFAALCSLLQGTQRNSALFLIVG